MPGGAAVAQRGASPWTFLVIGAAVVLSCASIGLDGTVGAVGVAIQFVFAVFFVRHFGFALAAMDTADTDLRAPLPDPEYLPTVTVLCACKNEAGVVVKLVENLLELDYPEELLQLVVIDDGSVDATGGLLALAGANHARLTSLRRPPGLGRRQGGGPQRRAEGRTRRDRRGVRCRPPSSD